MLAGLPAHRLQPLVNVHQLADVILIPAGVHLDLQPDAPLVAVHQQHVMGGIQLIIQLRVHINQRHRHDNLRQKQQKHRPHGNHGVDNQAQLEIGKKVHHKQGNDLSDNQIQPVKLPEQRAVGVQKQDIQQRRIDTHQHIFALVRKLSDFVSLSERAVIQQGHNHHFQQRFRRPDKSLGVLICAAAQLSH